MGVFWGETWAQLRRWLIRLRRERFNLLFALLQPLLFFVFFGGALEGMVRRDVTDASYRTFLFGGVLVLTVFGNSLSGGIPILFDKENGFLARCLAAPVSRSSILVARFLAVNLITAIQILIFLAVALPFGVRVASGLPGIALIILYGWLLGLGITILSFIMAFRLRGHADFFAILGTVTFPIAFLSSAFVKLETMPGWMQAVARLNPLTPAVEAMRALVIRPELLSPRLLREAAFLLVFDALMLWWGVRTLKRSLS